MREYGVKAFYNVENIMKGVSHEYLNACFNFASLIF